MPRNFMDGRTRSAHGPFAPTPVLERLVASIVLAPDGCWEWNGCLDKDGYGRLRVGSRTIGAHRAAYEISVGPVPEGLCIDHLCRNRKCINPAHLEPVTKRENTLRGVSPVAVRAKKNHCKRGHPLSGANLYRMPNGGRACKACRDDAAAHYRARKQAEASA